jgi:hypothetical protein
VRIRTLARWLPYVIVAFLAGCYAGPTALSGGASAAILPAHPTPGTSTGDLVYAVNTVTGGVMVFTYPRGTYVGGATLGAGLNGECVDARGNVFVTQTDTNISGTIYKFKHGAVTPTAVFSDPYPSGAAACAVNPKNGELAVVGIVPGGSGYGVVAMYEHAKGKPEILTECCYLIDYCAYDSAGNLYLLASDSYSNGTDFLVQIPAGTTTFEMMNTDVSIYQGGYGGPTLQWNGGHLIVSSYLPGSQQQPSTVYAYELSVNGSTATMIHKTVLRPHAGYVGAALWVQDRKILGFIRPRNGGADIASWHYPDGGTPAHTFTDSYLDNEPQGLDALIVSADPATCCYKTVFGPSTTPYGMLKPPLL